MHYATELPLHGGHAPKWLYQRMVRLSRSIGLVIIDDFGVDELLSRLSDSNWFQALSCAIGFDWHSSGTTSVTIAALKEALNDTGELYIAGGKGKAGLKTPEEITKGADLLSISAMQQDFKDYSRLSAKVDSAMVYDDIGIYVHAFAFTRNKKWVVIQQALDNKSDKAIRFQWFSDLLDHSDIVNEPHASLTSGVRKVSLDLTSGKNKWVRGSSVEILEDYTKVVNTISYPERHNIMPRLDVGRRGMEAIKRASELEPKDYKELLLIKGVGRSSLRSLALISSLIYDKELSYRDPITYAYTVGGKDGFPSPINRKSYDAVIENMELIVDKANIEREEKYSVLKRLNKSLSEVKTPAT